MASVAGFDPVRVLAVAAENYAVTLWTFMQREEAERFASLTREREDMTLAAMVATGYHDPKKLNRFEQDWQRRAIGPAPTQETREEMSRRADDLWAQHEAAMSKSRLVS